MSVAVRQALFALFLIGCASAAAMSDAELRERITLNSRQDNAKGAQFFADAVAECAAHAASRSSIPRRAAELMLCELQDIIAKLSSPEAYKVLAASLPRQPVEGLVTLCYAFREMPASGELDGLALRMLAPGMDFRARVALTDLLGAHKYSAAREKIATGLNPLENIAVQIATCRALALIPDKKSIPDLIKYLHALPIAKGRFGFEAVCALHALSGQNFDLDPKTWEHWWTENQKTFALADGKPNFNYELSEKQDLYYYDVPVVENRLVLVLDTSGSMILGGKPNRIESLKTEARNLISALSEKKLFNLVTFSGNFRRWRKEGLVTATAANKKEALAFIDSLRPEGGTQTILAMEDALTSIAISNGCECVYLVTDGNPNPWAPNVTAAEQERLIRWINQPLKVRINTIGIYSTAPTDKKFTAAPGMEEDFAKMQKFLIDIAANNDGVYRELGRDGTNKVVKVDPKKDVAMKDKKEEPKKEMHPKDEIKKDPFAPEKPVAAEEKKPEPLSTKPSATNDGDDITIRIRAPETKADEKNTPQSASKSPIKKVDKDE